MKSETALTRTQRARRDDIVAAAVTVLDRDGFGAATVDRIAAEADTIKGTVLYHFGGKDAIYRAVVEQLYAKGAEYMRPRIEAADGHRARLRAHIESNLRFIADNRAHVNAVQRILFSGGPAEGVLDGVADLATKLADGQAAGEFGDFDPRVLALAIRSFIDGVAGHFTAHPDIDLEHYITEATRAFDRATAVAEGHAHDHR